MQNDNNINTAVDHEQSKFNSQFLHPRNYDLKANIHSIVPNVQARNYPDIAQIQAYKNSLQKVTNDKT